MGKSRSQKKYVYTFNLKKLVRLGKSAFTATVSCRSRIIPDLIRDRDDPASRIHRKPPGFLVKPGMTTE